MRQLRFIGIILAVCGGALVVCASAFASSPVIIPTTITAYESKNVGESELSTLSGGLSTVKCKTATGSGTIVEGTHGTFKMNLKECKSSVGTCTGLGDPTGVILYTGNYEFVYDSLSPMLGTAILWTLTESHFNCSSLVLVLMKGQMLCLVLSPLTVSKSHEYHCSQSAAGDASETEYWNAKAEHVKITELLLSTNGGTNEMSAQLTLGTIDTVSAYEFRD